MIIPFHPTAILFISAKDMDDISVVNRCIYNKLPDNYVAGKIVHPFNYWQNSWENVDAFSVTI
jgi:hypothetical protein